jgi:aminopeptidase N
MVLRSAYTRTVFSVFVFCSLIVGTNSAQAQQTAAPPPQSAQPSHSPPLLRRRHHPEPLPEPPTKAEILRGAYGPYRSNNNLLFYDLTVRVDPTNKVITGDNIVRFKMLQDGTRIQLDLHPALKIERILFRGAPLKYTRDESSVFIDFPQTLASGKTYSVDFFYSGTPVEEGRFGGFSFTKDPEGRPWIVTSCEDVGASVWWPNKDQWKDEPDDGMAIHVAAPNGLMDVSNGRFESKKDLGDGYTQWNWRVHYPINNYDVALNIGNYDHFSDKYGKLTLDYYVLPDDLDKAKRQFTQVKGMLEAYEHYFGPYPFPKDGYKLVQVPYLGMEHQTAVAYGNGFANGYMGRDWTGVGISPKFDFIIIHESGHEWFGNSITAQDRADMWIHEGWTTYLEGLYVEYRWGKADAIAYLNGDKDKIENRRPIIPDYGVYATPPGDQYFKGALMINTLRSIVNDDAKWFKLLREFYQHFKYQTITTDQVVAWWSEQTGFNLTPFFDQYLRHKDIPVLELKFDSSAGTVEYRWKADEKDFSMPVRVGTPANWEIIHPTTEWQTMKTSFTAEQFAVATDLYYVGVSKS